MRRICIVVTARPSYSRVKTVLEAIRDSDDLELQLVVGASALLDRYGSAIDVMRQDGFEPAATVYAVLEGENPTSMAKTTGLAMLELATVFDNLAPDVVVSVADRFETLATAVAAAYMNIPLAHIQGGEVSGSIDEKVRHAVTKLSDLHLVATAHARDRVLKMGEHPERVHVTGCPSIDLADAVLNGPPVDFNPFQRYGGVGAEVDLSGGYLVVLQHPVTTEYDASRSQILNTMEAVASTGLPTLVFWPNVDAGADGTSNGIRSFRESRSLQRFHFFKNMEPHDFLRLLVGSSCLVGNSSVGIRESGFLGVPVVNIGTRQAGRERSSNVIDVDHDKDAIEAAIRSQIAHGRYGSDPLYGAGRSGEQIAAILATAPLGIEKRLAY